MLADSLFQIVGDTRVEYCLFVVGEYINVEIIVYHKMRIVDFYIIIAVVSTNKFFASLRMTMAL